MRTLIRTIAVIALAAGLAACQPHGRVGVGFGTGGVGIGGSVGGGGIGVGGGVVL